MTLLLALLLAPLTLLTFCFAVELLAGLRPLRQVSGTPVPSVNAVIIVPAHDEEQILADRLGALKAAAADCARILLVADNCSDSTADIARRLGVEVIERFDSDRRGKGFALAFARQELTADPPEVVMIIDADCETDPESIRKLIGQCASLGRPCQATNLQRPAPKSSPAVQLSTFAFFVKNVVRQRALQRLAARVQLLGTGMAFPWSAFARAELATSSIVEDLKLGQELAWAGYPPLFVEAAQIWSGAETQKNTLSQRRRWEGGFLQNSLRVGPMFLLRSLARGDFRGVWAAINLMIPPIALLIFLDCLALLAAALALLFVDVNSWPILMLSSAIALACLGLMGAWRAGGSRFVTLGALVRVPLYVLWKLPIYAGLVREGAPKSWMRTERGS